MRVKAKGGQRPMPVLSVAADKCDANTQDTE